MFGLSPLGIFHTVISIVAVIVAIYQIVLFGKIKPHAFTGKVYIYTTAIGCLTAFGLSKQGGFNPGHLLAILTLACLVSAWIVERKSLRYWKYLQVTLLSLSLFFSLIPAIGETLTRLPLEAPLASNLESPLVQQSVGILFVSFVLLLLFQLYSLKKIKA